MIFQDHALSQASMYFLKIILSLSGAVMLATLPGFMDVNYTVGGFSVRAAGGAAAFVFIYTQSPNLPVLKLDPAQARPGSERQSLPKSDNLSQLTNGYPTLMAFSLVPPGMLFASAPSNGAATQSGGFEAGVDIDMPGSADTPLGDLAGGGISLVKAVSMDAMAVVSTVAAYVRTAAREMRTVLDTAASALRGGVSQLASKAGDLLGVLKTLGGAPRVGLALVSENLSARTDELLSDLAGPEPISAAALLTQVGGMTTELLGGLPNSIEGAVSSLDHTVQTLTSSLQGTANSVLHSTETLAHGVTDLLDDATGGLTSGLTPAANQIVSSITSTTGRVVDGLTPVVADTASQVLNGVGDKVGRLTEQLNAVSPALIATIDSDFGAGKPLLQLPDRLDTVGSVPLLGKLGDTLDKFGPANQHGVLAGGADRNLFANKFADPLGGETLRNGPTCIGGCGGKLLSGIGGSLSDSVSGLTAAQGRLLGSLNGGGPASSGGLASGGNIGGGPMGGPGGGGHTSQGPISSAVGTTRSILGGATKLIGRR